MKYPPEKNWPHPTYTFGASEADWTLIPDYMIGGLRRYIEDGIVPGHFLQAVLKNDLFGAIERADDTNIQIISNYARFFYNYAPYDCWGGEKQYKKWIEKGGLNGHEENPNDEEGKK